MISRIKLNAGPSSDPYYGEEYNPYHGESDPYNPEYDPYSGEYEKNTLSPKELLLADRAQVQIDKITDELENDLKKVENMEIPDNEKEDP